MYDLKEASAQMQARLPSQEERNRIAMEDETNVDQHDMSRRKLLKVAGMGIGALALGGSGAIGLESALTPTSAYAASTFIKGADISWLPQMEAKGYKFYNSSGVQQDLLTILKGYGINAIRLRTFVNPSSDPVNGHCSITETAAMAVRCKNAGLPVDIDFHFGDTWNSVGVQNPPAAWASMTYSQMLTAMNTYVYHSMNVLKTNGVTPGWVQIGNEINSGICHPVGSLAHYPKQMTGLLNAAYAMVKEVFPSTPVMIHLAQPQKLSVIESFFDTHKSNGGKWDITAFSSYGSGSEIPGIVSDMATAKSRYGKPVMQVEFGGPVSKPASVKADLTTYIKGLKGFGGLGIFYWEPEGYSPFTSYTMGAWDSTTKRPTAALQGFLND
jgi:arabinogalactan endo-1,4-beta-galactosidase